MGTGIFEGGMGGMPDALPTVDSPARRYALPSGLEGLALVANPFGRELKGSAFGASLHDQLVAARRFIELTIDAIVCGDRNRYSGWQIRFRGSVLFAHRTSLYRCKIKSLTGATIGPDTTSDISASLTWQVEVPRTWRAASMINSRPCM